MRVVEVSPEYLPGGRAVLDLGMVTYHVRGVSGLLPGETGDVLFLRQVHGGKVLVNPDPRDEGDGMILPADGPCPGIVTADCLPVFLASRHYCAAMHVGWRGVVAGIAAGMIEMYPEPPGLVILGNCICGECYRVGEDVRRKVVSASAGAAHPEGGVDLKLAVLAQMSASGLPPETGIVSIPECTMCEPDLFFSYRRNETKKRNYQWLEMNGPVLAGNGLHGNI